MIERDFKKMKLNGRVHWRGLKKIITKIEDVNKTATSEVSRGLVEGKTSSSEVVDGLMDILKRYNNNNGGSCDIEELKKYIEKEVLEKPSTASLDSETPSTQPHLMAKTENNNGNGSCNDANIKESVNDEPDDYTLVMKRLSKNDKDELLDTMKVHFEGFTGEKLTTGNIEQFGRFVKEKHDEYSIHDVMVDAKNKFNLEVSA